MRHSKNHAAAHRTLQAKLLRKMEMALCSTCKGITLDKLCDGFRTLGYPSIESSAEQCKLCQLLLHALSEPRQYQVDVAHNTSGRLTLRAIKELPFALPTQNELPVHLKAGRRVTRLDIIHEHRVCGTLGVFAYEDDPLAVSGDLLAHPLNKEVKSSQIFDKIATWIYDCDTKHQLCRHLRQSGDHPFNQNEPPPLPSRVLDLCLSDGSEDIRLIESFGSCGLYAALSHCWGTAPLITTLKSTVTARLDRIEFLDLSRTFQDAATIARELKLRYLWIDSLCIIQDDSSDWERESARMGDIYRNAFITIAAAGARDGSEGCFIPRLEPILEPVCFQQTSSKGEEGSMWIGLYPGDFISSVTSGPLNARGWVLQERVLASRTVHFAKEQVFWECDQLTISEDGRAMFHYDSLRHILSPLPSLHLQYLARNQSPSQFLYDQWYSLVENYTSRKLTKLDDIFPALSGVVSEVTKLISDEYIAGLWKSCLHVGLLWQSKGVNWGGLPRPTVKRAPSWSWAAVDGPISYLSSSRIRHTKVNFSAITIHDAYCAIFGQNPYGQINKSFIKLTGLLKEAILDDGDQPEIPGFEIQFPKGHLVGTGYLDAEAGPKENIFVLKISKSSEKSEPGLFWFVLLLKQVEEGSDCYERVGMGKLTEFNWFDDSLDKTITLI